MGRGNKIWVIARGQQVQAFEDKCALGVGKLRDQSSPHADKEAVHNMSKASDLIINDQRKLRWNTVC